MANKKLLKDNPVLQKTKSESEFTVDVVKGIKDSWDTSYFEVMSTLIRKTYKKLLRDYAYTNRLTIKEALDKILCEFFNGIDKDKLIERLEIPSKRKGV